MRNPIDYSFEARPYAIVLACGGIALISWQTAVEDGVSSARRVTALVVFAAALAAGLLSHCYAVLLYFPFGLAELWREWRHKRFDPPLWLAFCISLAPLALYPSLIASSHKLLLGTSIFAPTPRRFLGSYAFILKRALFPLSLLLLPLVFVALRDRVSLTKNVKALMRSVPMHEIVAVFLFTLIPACGFAVAKSIHGQYVPRYSIAAAIGFSVLLAYAVFVAGGPRARWPIWMAAGALLWSSAVFVIDARHWKGQTASGNVNEQCVIAAARTGRPVVVSNETTFLELAYYLPADDARRLVFLSDREVAIRLTGTDINSEALVYASPWMPVPCTVEDYRHFLAVNQNFWLYAVNDHPLEWVFRQLQIDGAVLSRFGDTNLYDVKMTSMGSASDSRIPIRSSRQDN